MKLFILLALIPFVAFASDRCLTGTVTRASILENGASGLRYGGCSGFADICYIFLDQNNIYNMGCETADQCEARRAAAGGEVVCCNRDLCNRPDGIRANKDGTLMADTFHAMKNIMYTVMGSIFMVLWLVFAFLIGAIPSFLLIVLGIIDVVFGYFLIFIPAAHYLGLYFMLLGAATVAGELHLKDRHTHRWIILGSVVGFLLISGLTFIPFTLTPYFDLIANSNCASDLGLDYGNDRDRNLIGIPTRCENYLLYVLFCVYLLILMQPFKVMLAFKHAAGRVHDRDGHTKTTTLPAGIGK